MRRFLVLAALLVAAPAAAQQVDQLQATAEVPAAAASQPQAAPAAEPAPRPTLFVSRERIDAQLSAEQAVQTRAMGQTEFLYTVAAVALGVLIAMLLID